VINTEHLPKAEEFGDFMYFTLKILQFNEATGAIDKNHISFILGKKVIISFAQKDTPLFVPFIERIEAAAAKVRTRRCDYIFYRLVDIVVDHYFALFYYIDQRLEQIEDSLVSEPTIDKAGEIQEVKKEILYLKRNIFPVAEAIRGMVKDELKLFNKQTFTYINDTMDHLYQLNQILETSRETVSSLMEMQMANNSNRMNEVMKTLTMIATIFIPLTFLAGIYGMNFAYMPELSYTWAYPALLAVMFVVGVVMYIYMKRKRWF
jgi:magnesium transporter